MILLDISIKLGNVESIYSGLYFSPSHIETYKVLFQWFRDTFAWNYEEILGINPNIVVHKIKMYPGAKPIQKCHHPVHEKKAT